MKRIIVFLTLLFLTTSLILNQSCSNASNKEPIKIAISRDHTTNELNSYSGWISRFEGNVEFYNLYPMGIDSAMRVLKTCDGILLSGGADIYPAYYNKINDTSKCGSFNHYRDSLEFNAIKTALYLKMPIIGICRGEQILNVSQGGSLIVDIPTHFDSTIKHRQTGMGYTNHEVFVVDESLLSKVCKTKSGIIISNHHQGIDILGSGLKITAYSKDHLPEAIEWENKYRKSFLMAVQWHPERMDTLNILSAPLAKEFIKEVKIFKEERLANKITSTY